MFSPPLTIRSFQDGDFEALFRMDQICFPADIAFSRGELLSYLNHPKSIARVAEGPAGILGFILARTASQKSAHVLTLDVLPEFRRNGIGSALMNAFHEDIRSHGIRISILEVGIQNIAAQRLYERLGYRLMERLDGYYRGREDAYRMLRLAGA